MRVAEWNLGDFCGSDTDWKYGDDGAGRYLQSSHVWDCDPLSPVAEMAEPGTRMSAWVRLGPTDWKAPLVFFTARKISIYRETGAGHIFRIKFINRLTRGDTNAAT